MMYFWNILPVLLGVPAQLAFTILFSVRVFGAGEWWRDPVGRALFIKSLSVSLVAVMLLFEFFYRVDHGAQLSFGWKLSIVNIMLTSAYWTASIAIYYQLIVLIRIRKEEKRLKKENFLVRG